MENIGNSTPNRRGRKPGSKGHCSYCGEVGHYKRTCPKFKKEVAEGTVLVEVNLKTGVDPDDK